MQISPKNGPGRQAAKQCDQLVVRQFLEVFCICKHKARAVRIDCKRSYVRRCIKGAMMSFKEETAESLMLK